MDESAGVLARRLPALPSLAHLRRGAVLALSRGGAVAAQMAVQIAVGSVAGASGIGLLQLHMAWSNLAGELVGAGEASRALRDTAIHADTGGRDAVRARLRRTLLRIGAIALLLAVTIALALRTLPVALSPTNCTLVVAVLLAAPLFAAVRVLSETLKALGDPLAAVTLENLIVPLALLSMCAAVALGLLQARAAILLGSAVAGLALALLLLDMRLRQRLATLAPKGRQGAYRRLGGRYEQHYLWLNGLLNIAFLQLPFLLLPWFVDTADIGRFAVAHKLVNIITTLLILLSAVYGPRFARAAATGDGHRLRCLLIETQRLSLLLFLPAWFLLVAGAQPLARLFSLAPDSLLPLLVVLGGGQLANAATGLSGVLLSMSGGAAAEFRILALSTIATLLATCLAATTGSLSVVALAIAGGIAARNALSWAAACRHISHRMESSR
jgi:O-antigen/teichoic acid export membrane protein